ncbi:chemotaxis protein [Roseibium denhamense]|uniref:Methyl-accepting chemotaxis protein n=1 Tax=Roseibium denhamense TaxID=76305 RepID=A0ABY1NZ32_9HYPH|nr:methyl-accepting chemotaxis protein [Roseibium denhamense]MTI05153.1 chemotaxis protein [Roseibium denhamense]SMP22404.1 methyl-accepting chemotaxis protein [Roseibium denhamense]
MTDPAVVLSGLDSLRERFSRLVIHFTWFNVFLVMATAWLVGTVSLVVVCGAALLLGAAATAVWLKCGAGVETRLATAMSLAGLVALFVAALSANDPAASYQLDGHMYFFAVLAVLACWVDWRALAAYVGVVAVHHLVLNFLLPAAVFPGGTDLGRVVFHAAILIAEFGALWWLTGCLSAAFQQSESAREEAEEAIVNSQRLQDEKQQAGDLERQRQDQVNDRIRVFQADISGKLNSVEAKIDELRTSAADLSSEAGSTADRAASVSDASETASANVQMVASASEELSSSIAEISRQVDQTKGIVVKATDNAQTSNQKVEGLAEAANRIGEVVTLIQAIAEQTNLLALNATIEAARAGEAGKGFAVVAAEVKELATQTSKATEEIGAQIAAIQAETKDAVESIGVIAANMDEVNSYTAAIAAAVDEQGSATQEISRNVAEAADGTGRVASNIGSVRESAERTGVSVSSMVEASQALESEADDMRHAIDTFLKDVSAA